MKINLRLTFGAAIFLVFLLFSRTSAQQDISGLAPNVTISLDFQDASLKSILKLLSQQSGLNFIASQAVQDRTVTLYLDKVPLKDALDKIFKANNLEYELDKKSNIFIVKDWGAPQLETVTRIFTLKYASVANSSLKKELTDQMSSSGSSTSLSSSSSSDSGSSSSGSGASTSLLGAASSSSSSSSSAPASGITSIVKGLLTKSGSVIEDPRTNSLIITDVPNQMPVIEKTILALDVPTPLILIEVEMLDVSKNLLDKLGVKFGQTPITLNTVFQGAATASKFPFGSFLNTGKSITDGLVGINTGSEDSAVSTYTILLDFLRSQTDTKDLARPKLLTLNNETAEIKITTNESVGVKTSTSSTGTTNAEPERAETGVSLRVTPQVNAETGEVTMFIYPQVAASTAGNTITSAGEAFTYRDTEVRNTRSVVRIKDGETIIVGGLIRNERLTTYTKLPFFGDIPVLGLLFRHKDDTKNKERELLVFITPHIVKDNVATSQIKPVKGMSAADREQGTLAVNDRYAVINNSMRNFEYNKR